MKTCEDYRAACSAANVCPIAFEHGVLTSGREFLPRCARRVLDASRHSLRRPTSSGYWEFLLGEMNKYLNQEDGDTCQ